MFNFRIPNSSFIRFVVWMIRSLRISSITITTLTWTSLLLPKACAVVDFRLCSSLKSAMVMKTRPSVALCLYLCHVLVCYN
jgi:hypothetical protein